MISQESASGQLVDAADPARVFYERSYAAQHRSESDLLGISTQSLDVGNHRYSSAFRFLRENPGLRVLELGYGGNGAVEQLAPLALTYEVVDILDRTDPARRPSNLKLHVSNLDKRFPFEDGQFDVVIAMMVIEHLFDPFYAFAEVCRVAKCGANIFINLPNVGSYKCRRDLLMGRLPVTSSNNWFEAREWDGGHLHYFTVDSVRQLASVSGLDIKSIEPVGAFAAVKRLWPSLLCHEITYCLEKM